MEAHKIRYRVIAILILITLIFSLFQFCIALYALGSIESATQYSNVLDDLQKDSSFNMEHYPEVSLENTTGDTDEEKKTNYARLDLIQIAESVSKELFVYVYQPSGKSLDLKASYISFSTEPKEDIKPKVYKLKFLNSTETIYKYVVEDFTVSSEETRYYTIVELFRAFDKNYDKDTDNDNTINSVSYAVEKQYTLSEINGKPYVSVTDIETIEIKDKWVGFCRYPDGFYLYADGACDAHFVAFSTDRKIDDLREADVYYEYQKYYYQFSPYGGGESENYGEVTPCSEPVRLTGKNVTYEGGGLWAGSYEWKEIQTVDEFKKGEERNDVYEHGIFNQEITTKLTTDALEKKLQGKQWVLRFLSTKYTNLGTDSLVRTDYTIVQNVTILRLKFVTDGITYNLGVVDNMQSGDNKPDNVVTQTITVSTDKIESILKIMLALILVALILVILAPILPYIFKVILWIISLPFKAIQMLFKTFKKKGS